MLKKRLLKIVMQKTPKHMHLRDAIGCNEKLLSLKNSINSINGAKNVPISDDHNLKNKDKCGQLARN